MIRFLVIFLLSLSTAAAAFAQYREDGQYKRWNLMLSGGYSTVDMSDVNNDYAALSNSYTKINSGWFGALEALYRVHPQWGLGLRSEYLKTSQGKIRVMGFDETEDLSIVPIMVGGRYQFKRMSEGGFAAKSGLNVGLYAGWATAWGELDFGQKIKYRGSGFAGDLLVGWEYPLGRTWMLGVDLGYRYAPISEMKVSENYPSLGVAKDAVIVDHNGSTLKYDFSGLIASVGVGVRF